MQKGLDHIIATRHDQINLIKNGWANYTEAKHGEYVDVTIIFVLPGVCKNTQKLPEPHKTKEACDAAGNCEWRGKGVCCEVQLLTKPLYDFKKCLHKDYGMMRIINSPKGTELSTAIKEWSESVDALQNSRRENSRPSRSPSARTHNLDKRRSSFSPMTKTEPSESPAVDPFGLTAVPSVDDSGYNLDSESGPRRPRTSAIKAEPGLLKSRSRTRRRRKERAATMSMS